MGRVVPTSTQKASAEKLCNAISKMKGVEAEPLERSSGTKPRWTFSVVCEPENWRNLAEKLSKTHLVDYCSMITGIHWPEGPDEKKWEVIYHFLRTGVKNPPSIDGVLQPIVTDPNGVKGKEVPLEIEVSIRLPDTRTPSVASIQDIWVGADWNEKETWDLVGIDFDGHVGMRRVLQPHETPTGYHPLQRHHNLRYHEFEEMYDDPQGFGRKPDDIGKVK